mgnify:CR=1 FL=1|tara:strand:- start:350 stop:718 length:369 start_codon:yes stop_codon:yes gene_type:complete
MYSGDEDQLAFILAHELSHYLCEHGSEERTFQGIFSILQLIVLATVDPTGLLSLGTELPVFKSLFELAIRLPMARGHETEADSLGLQLVARSCRDPMQESEPHSTLSELVIEAVALLRNIQP